MGSTKIETTEDEPSQKEKTPKRSDKGKGVSEQTPSSSRGRSLLQQVPRWLRKEMIRSKKPQFSTDEVFMIELIKVLSELESP